MARRDKFLSDVELEIMFFVWKKGCALTSIEILENLPRSWQLSTLMTVLSRLERKQLLYCDRSTRTNMYSALKNHDRYLAEMCIYIMDVHKIDSTTMLSALYGEGVVSREELLSVAGSASG